MVMPARRTYADAVSWIKHARPAELDRTGFAFRTFGAFFATATVAWGVGAYVSPASFGQPGADVLSLGWPTAVYAALVIASVVGLALASRRIVWVVRRVREPYERVLAEDPNYEGAMNALAATARPLQVRFAIGWTWGPMVVLLAAGLLAFSAAYLVVYGILAGGDVGRETYSIAAGDALLGLILLIATAGRLSTWRLATSVYRSVILM